MGLCRYIRSDQISCSVVSNSLWPHVSQHSRPPCPSQTPGVHSDSHPLSRWCHPTISSSVIPISPSIFPSIESYSNESVLCIRWPRCWSFSFSISPSSEYSGLISFRMDWLYLHHSSKASIPQGSAFFIVQLLHPYMTTGKTIALTRWTFVGKAMPLLFFFFLILFYF